MAALLKLRNYSQFKFVVFLALRRFLKAAAMPGRDVSPKHPTNPMKSVFHLCRFVAKWRQ
jgi:hypothetical protein